MKNRKTGLFLPLTIFLFGIIAMILRRLMYLTATDEKGLLLRFSPLEIGSLLMTAAVFCILLIALRKVPAAENYHNNYSQSFLFNLGHMAAATGIFLTVYPTAPVMAGYLGEAWKILGLAAPVCLILAGIIQTFGRKPFFLLHVIPCLFFMVHIINCYQLWSSNPQMQDYLFALLGIAALTLFSFYTAAAEAECGNRRLLIASGLAAVYLCLAELGWTSDSALYFGGAFWALTGMLSMAPSSAGQQE